MADVVAIKICWQMVCQGVIDGIPLWQMLCSLVMLPDLMLSNFAAVMSGIADGMVTVVGVFHMSHLGTTLAIHNYILAKHQLNCSEHSICQHNQVAITSLTVAFHLSHLGTMPAIHT